jgi:BirA family biotin operon repressor/biotin-[acetyl-CoA-carboxylase] ligase
VPLWSQYDALHNATIQLISDDVTQTVKAQGIDENGALRYEHQNQLHTLSNSHVSIRFAS